MLLCDRVFRQTHAEEAMLTRLVRLSDSIMSAAIVELLVSSLESLATIVDTGVIDATVLQKVAPRTLTTDNPNRCDRG